QAFEIDAPQNLSGVSTWTIFTDVSTGVFIRVTNGSGEITNNLCPRLGGARCVVVLRSSMVARTARPAIDAPPRNKAPAPDFCKLAGVNRCIRVWRCSKGVRGNGPKPRGSGEITRTKANAGSFVRMQ